MKNKSKYLKRTAFVVVFIVLFWAVNETARFLVVDDTKSYTRVTLEEMYEQKEIDVLFLGSSHCYRAINPAVLDDIWETNTFNLGSSSQRTDGSYYLLKEAGKSREIKKVYMEVFCDVVGQNESYQSPNAMYIISDYMKPSFNRMEYLWKSGGEDYLVHGLVLSRRNWENLFDPIYIKDILRKKINRDYLNYEYVTNEDEYYAGKGFVYSQKAAESDFLSSASHFAPISEEAISVKSQEYLNKIISYCQSRGIEIVFYSAPMPDFRLIDIGNYDSYIMQMKDFLKGKNVTYYDFNLCRPEFLDLDGTDFQDDQHLNGKGANAFTAAFAGVMSEKDPEKAFYDSYEQKLKESPAKAYGLICECTETAGDVSTYTITPIVNKLDKIYYAISKREENDADYHMLRDYEEDRYFTLPANENGYIYVYMTFKKEGKTPVHEAKFNY